MDTPVPVRVNWTGNLPSSARYITVARFEEDKNWPHGAWSIVLEFDSTQAVTDGIGKARYLAPEGPNERLRPGVVFTMYEGRTPTARVTVLS